MLTCSKYSQVTFLYNWGERSEFFNVAVCLSWTGSQDSVTPLLINIDIGLGDRFCISHI